MLGSRYSARQHLISPASLALAMPREPHDIPDPMMRIVLAWGLGPTTFARLREHFESIEEIAGASIDALTHVEGVGRRRAERIKGELDAANPEAERDEMARAGVRFVFIGDADYPRLLINIADPPIALWIRGELREEDQLAIAMVGSRRCTQYGREQAGRFGSMLAQSGLTIVSGGARGIDGEAHRAALRVSGRTIVVCGCGLSTDYPPEHAELFERIAADGGAIISEFPMRTAPKPEHFPRRNRVISGLSLGVLLIEAAKGSGALITARLAGEEHGREVMAVPGRLDSPASAGCLRAIRDGWAALVLDHADVLMQLESVARHLVSAAIDSALTPVTPAENAADTVNLLDLKLTEPQRRIVTALREAGEPVLLDQLSEHTQLPMDQLLSELTLLQIRKIITRREAKVSLRSSE